MLFIINGLRERKREDLHKRKFLMHGTLKIAYQVYHSKQDSKKRKSTFFICDNFVHLKRCVGARRTTKKQK
jgi:hypothetical protein